VLETSVVAGSSGRSGCRGRRGRFSRGRLRGALFVAVVVGVGLSWSAAGAVQTEGLGIGPAREADYFHLSLLPGGQTSNTAVVSNYSDKTARVRVYAVDGGLTPQGQFSLGGEAEPRQTVGSWLVLNVSALTLAPHTSAEVGFTLAVPAGTAPQDYVGGIVVEGEPRSQPSEAIGQTAVQLNVVERLGVRVYLRVEGEAREHVVAGPLRWVRAGAGIEFALGLRNDGNVSLTPTGVVNLDGFGLAGPAIELSRPELLLPGAETTVRGRWANPPRYAFGQADAVVSYGDGHTTGAATSVRLIPVFYTAVLALLGMAFLYGAYRTARFVRAARAALNATRPASNHRG
jgi:hypothetical protein